MLWWSIWFCRAANSSVDWPIASGKILSVRDGVNRGGGAEYEYWVNGKRYVSKRIAFPASYIPSRISDIFSVGGIVDVKYDPDYPSTAVLIAGSLSNQYLLFLGPFCMFLFGYCLLHEKTVERCKRIHADELLLIKPKSLVLIKKDDRLIIKGGLLRVHPIVVSFFQSFLTAALIEVFVDLLVGYITIVWGVGSFALMFLLPLFYVFHTEHRVEIVMMASGVSILRMRRSDTIRPQHEVTCLYSALDRIVCNEQSKTLTLFLAKDGQVDINARDGFSVRELVWLKNMIEISREAWFRRSCKVKM